MILDLIFGLLTSLLSGLLSLLPEVTWPAWLVGTGSGTMRGTVTELAGYMSGFGTWLPLGTFGTVLETAAAVVTVALVVRGVRFVLSIVTLGGGQA